VHGVMAPFRHLALLQVVNKYIRGNNERVKNFIEENFVLSSAGGIKFRFP
jgi:hypothetical protein